MNCGGEGKGPDKADGGKGKGKFKKGGKDGGKKGGPLGVLRCRHQEHQALESRRGSSCRR